MKNLQTIATLSIIIFYLCKRLLPQEAQNLKKFQNGEALQIVHVANRFYE